MSYIISLLSLLTLSLTSTSQAQGLNFVDHPAGLEFNFSQGVPPDNTVWFAEAQFSAVEWDQNRIAGPINAFIMGVTKQPLVRYHKSHAMVMKAAAVIRKPATVLNKEKYLAPQFHIRPNSDLKMNLVSQTPLIFRISADDGPVTISSDLHIYYFDRNEINAQSALQQLRAYHGLSSIPPQYMTFRFADGFNRLFDLAVTASEFYPIDAYSTLVVTYVFFSGERKYFTGIPGPAIKKNLKIATQSLISDSLDAIGKLP